MHMNTVCVPTHLNGGTHVKKSHRHAHTVPSAWEQETDPDKLLLNKMSVFLSPDLPYDH